MKSLVFLPFALTLLLAPPSQAADALGGILDPVYVAPQNSGDRIRLAPPTAKNTIHSVTENELLGRLEKELIAKFNVDGELRLTFARGWQPIRIAADDWQMTLPELPIGGLSKSFLARVRISAGDRVWFDQQVVLEAQLFKPVLVATRRLERGQPLDATAAEIQTVDVLRERAALIPATTKLEEQEILQTVVEGRPLTVKDIGMAPLVRKGAVIEVVAGDGKMSISMKGLAMGTGGMGDAITVRNMDTRKDFQARVVNRNSVRVTF